MKKFVPFLLATLILSGVGLVRPALAEGIPGPQEPKPRSLLENIDAIDVSMVEIREALRNLFRRVGTSYSIAPDVQGTVTLSLRNVRFEDALTFMLRQVDADYRLEGGVVNIVSRRRDSPVEAPPVLMMPPAPPTLTFDKAHVYVVFEDRILKLRKDDLTEVDQNDRRSNASFGPERQITQDEYDRILARRFDVDFRERALPIVMAELARRANIPIRVEPNLRGVLTITLRQATLEQILAEMDKQIQTRHGFFRGRLHVGKNGIRLISGPDRAALMVANESPIKNFSAIDGDFLYICSASKIEKVRKSDLTRIAEATFSNRRF